MKRYGTLSLLGIGAKQSIPRGTIDIGKGKRLLGLRLKVTVPIANATGGATALTDADKQALQQAIQVTCNLGKDGTIKPFPEMLGLDRFQREARFCYGQEIQGYNDTTTGLGTNLPNAATTNLVFYPVIPLGKAWFLDNQAQRLLGCGRSQTKSLQLEVQLAGTGVLRANVTINGAQPVVIEVYGDLESCKGDQWGNVPFYRQFDTSADELSLAEGVPLRVSERTAIHSATALGSYSFRVDDEVVHEAMDPKIAITEYNNSAIATAAGSLVDRETILYAVRPLDSQGSYEDLPSGTPTVRQVVKVLNPMQLSMSFLPRITDTDVANALAWCVQSARPKTVKAISLAVMRGQRVPDRMAASTGFLIVDTDDREFELYPGWKMSPGDSAPTLDIPKSLLAQAKGAYDRAKGNGEAKAAAGVVKQVAAAVPGAVPSSRGFNRGSSAALAMVATQFS